MTSKVYCKALFGSDFPANDIRDDPFEDFRYFRHVGRAVGRGRENLARRNLESGSYELTLWTGDSLTSRRPLTRRTEQMKIRLYVRQWSANRRIIRLNIL